MEYFIILIVAVICLLAGLLAGYLIASQQDRRPEDRSTNQTENQYPPDAIHIWHDKGKDQIVLQLGKQIYHTSEPLPPTENKHITQLLKFLQKWVGIPTTPDPQPVAQTPQPPPASPQSIPPSPPEAVDMPGAEKSIVAQVDDILQRLLANSPLGDKRIRLTENLDGSMRICIGVDHYDDIGAVPDEAIQAVIRAAVREWEQLQ